MTPFDNGGMSTGWCDKRKKVVGRNTSFLPDVLRDFCNYFFKNKQDF